MTNRSFVFGSAINDLGQVAQIVDKTHFHCLFAAANPAIGHSANIFFNHSTAIGHNGYKRAVGFIDKILPQFPIFLVKFSKGVAGIFVFAAFHSDEGYAVLFGKAFKIGKLANYAN